MDRKMRREILRLAVLCVVLGMGTVLTWADAVGKTKINLTYQGVARGAPVTFLLKGIAEDTPMPGSQRSTEISLAPNTTGSFGTITYERPGVYGYEVSRKGSSAKSSQQDNSLYQVTVVVRNDGKVQQVIEKDGEKVTEIRYEDKSIAKVDTPVSVDTGDLQSLLLPGIGILVSSVGLLGLFRIHRKEKQGEKSQKAENETNRSDWVEPEKNIMEEERKPLSEYWKIMSVLFAVMIMVWGFPVQSSAGTKDLTVTYDRFQDLPANFVRITGLPLHEAEFTTTNSNIQKFNGYVGNNQTTKRDFIAYYGTVKYGSKNRTATENASTASNTISGTITLRWKDRAILSDNTKADVKVVVSGWTFLLGKNTNSKVTAGTKVYVPILQASAPQSNATELCSSSPRTSYHTTEGTNTTTLSGACILTHCYVKIQILKSGTEEPINATKYPRMLFGFRDLDVSDNSIATGKSSTVRYSGPYAEGIELINGFESPVCLAQKTNSNPAMQTLEKVTTVNDNLRISGDGAKFETYNQITGTTGDDGSYYSGFISPVKPQEFNFKWTGSAATTGKMLGTALWNQPQVAVRATAGEGGAIEKEGLTTYIINSSTTYDYTPAPGYRVKSLTVEGERVDFDETGGTYRFEKLYTSPATQRSSETGAVVSTKIYTIDVQFQRIEYQIDTEVINGTIDPGSIVGEGEDKTITYQPDEGYELEKITVDGKVVDAEEYPEQYDFLDVHDNHHIQVVYRKIPVSTLTIRKQVTGALGDRSKKFDFQVELSNLQPSKKYESKEIHSVARGEQTKTGFKADEDGIAILNYQLKADQSASIVQLPRGATYQVTEASSDHISSYEQTGNGEQPKFIATSKENAEAGQELTTEEEVVEDQDGDVEILVTNNRPIATVTGVGTSDVPYLTIALILTLFSGGWLTYVLKYRRKY